MLIKKIEKPEKTIISVLGIKIAHNHKKIFMDWILIHIDKILLI